MDPYEEILRKYNTGAQGIPVPSAAAKNPTFKQDEDPYDTIVKFYGPEETQRRTNYAVGVENDKKAAQPDGFLKNVWDVAKNVPSAAWQIAKAPFTDPVKTGQAVTGGLLDVGPAIVNSLSNAGEALLSPLARLIGTDPKELGFNLPMPGKTVNEYIGNNSPVSQALGEGAKMYGGYALGGALTKGAGITNPVANQIVGDVVGGQLVTDAEGFKERAKQAAFDAAFGAALEGVGAVTRRIVNGKTVNLEVGSEAPGDIAVPVNRQELGRPQTDILPSQPRSGVTAQADQSIVYIPKKDLGMSPSGERILARTEVDSRTGRAIIYYADSLDKNPTLKQTTLDHELGHVFDKRLNNGSNLSAELPNYTGNKLNLDNVFANFAKEIGKDVETVARELQEEITTLGRGSNQAEAFANAVAAYRANPEGAAGIAPTFARFMEHSPVTKGSKVESAPVISERTTTMKSLREGMAKSKELNTAIDNRETIQRATAPEAPAPEPKAKTVKVKDAKIASTGLDTGKRVKDRPAFNPKSVNAPDEVVQLMKDLGAQNDEFSSARVSKSNQDIKDLARLTGLTEAQLIKAQPGSIANAETLTAARQLVIDRAQDLQNFLKGVDITNATPEQLKEFKDKLARVVAMQKSVAGLRTEAANALRSLGVEVTPGENATLRELGNLLKEQGLDGDAAEFAASVGKTMQLTTLQKIGSGALSTWYSAILSGPKTTIRNLLGTTSNILTEIAAKAANPASWPEIPTVSASILKGLKEGFQDAKATLKGADTTGGKFMDNQSVQPEVFTGKWAAYGKVVESVGRFLNAQDRLLSSVARNIESGSLKARSGKVSEAVADALSKAYGEMSVYRGTPRGRVIDAVRQGTQFIRSKVPEAKIIIPFVDTVANVLDRQFDYLPITSQLRLRSSVLDRQATKIVRDYGLKTSDKPAIMQRLKDQQMGRMYLGTVVAGAAIALAAQGKVSGAGPTSSAEREQLMRTGWRPNSIKLGDTWVPYTYLGPLSGILSMAGNVYDKTRYDQSPTKTIGSLISKGLIGWVQTQLDSSFLSGTSDLIEVANGNMSPDKYFKRLATGLIPIPAAYSQTKDMIFDQQYETHSIVEGIRQKLGLTGDAFGLKPLEPRLDAFGEPMTSDLIFGLTPSREKFDSVDNFLVANDLVVNKPLQSTRYSIPGTNKETRALTPEEYTRYVKESGKIIYEQLLVRLPLLESMNDKDRQKTAIEKLTSDIRKRVRTQIMRESLN